MKESKNIIKVFVASSLQHASARLKIKERLEQLNGDGHLKAKINVYLHEKDGTYSFRQGEDSQAKISAEALSSNAFILYAGDAIGKRTIEEFENVLEGSDRNYTFIYVIHNPDDKLPDFNPEIHRTWKEFDSEYLGDKKHGVTYYEVQTSGETLDFHLDRIRDEMLFESLVPIFPADLRYENLLSSQQQKYRLGKDFYYPRPTDELIAQAVANPKNPLTIVAGESLSGKTRSIVHTLADISDDKAKVYFLRGADSDAAERFMHLNIEKQFPAGSKNIFVIDEIDRLLLNDSDRNLVADNALPRKFADLVHIAGQDPRRLVILGSTNFDTDELLNQLAKVDSALRDKTEFIDIEPMEVEEMHLLARLLRARNLIPTDALGEIKKGMPIGALFVDLSALNNIYAAALNIRDTVERRRTALLFHAIKSLALWKFSGRHDFDLLLDFYNFLLRPGRGVTAEELCSMLSRYPELITVTVDTGSGSSFFGPAEPVYSFEVEDVIRDRVMKFESQSTETPSDEDYTGSAIRIIGYLIDRKRSDSSQDFFRPLTILVSRVRRLLEDPKALSRIFDELTKLYPVDSLIDRHELKPTESEVAKDWVDHWLGVWAQEMLSRSDEAYTAVRAVIDKRPSQQLLAVGLRHERLNGLPDTLSHYLFEGGKLKPQYRVAESKELAEELVERFPTFEEALLWTEERDYDELVRRLSSPDYSGSIKNEAAVKARLAHTLVLLAKRITDSAQVHEVSAMLDRLDQRRRREGLSGIFADDREKYFAMLSPAFWEPVSKQIPSAELIGFFRQLNAIDSSWAENGKINRVGINKEIILNQLMRPMQKFDAIECWDSLAKTPDTFSLRMIMEKMGDFAEAKSIFEEYMKSHGKDKIKISLLLINVLLKLAKRSAEIEETNELCRLYGIFNEGENSVLDVNDPYTFGALYNVDQLPFDERMRIAAYHKNKFAVQTPRKPEELGSLIYRAGKFDRTYSLLYENFGLKYFTEEEQRGLQKSPVVVSMLFKKVNTDADGEKARNLIMRLIEEWSASGDLKKMIGDKDTNIITEIVRKGRIFSFDQLTDFLNRLKAAGIDPTGNTYFDRFFALRKIRHSLRQGDRAKAIEIANNLVLAYSHSSRSQLQLAMWIRCNIESAKDSEDLELDVIRIYPFVDADKTWSLREQTLLGFVKNMLEHRYAHSKVLYHVLLSLGRQLRDAESKDSRAALKSEIESLRDLAIEKRTFLDHISYYHLSELVSPYGVDLLAMAPEYSPMEDVAMRMSRGVMTRREAEEYVTMVARRRGYDIKLTQTFYDFAVTSERLSDKSVDELLQDIGQLPDGIIFSSRMFYTAMKGAKSLKDVLALEKAYITANPDAEIDSGMVLMLINNFESNLTVYDILGYISRHSLALSPEAFYHLLSKCNTYREYESLLPVMPDGIFTVNYVRALLYRFYDSDKRWVNWGLFRPFNNERTLRAWAELVKQSPDFKDKITDRLRYLKNTLELGNDLNAFAYKLLKYSGSR